MFEILSYFLTVLSGRNFPALDHLCLEATPPMPSETYPWRLLNKQLDDPKSVIM